MLEAEVTLDKEESFGVPNEELFKVPNITKNLNVTSANNKYQITNVSTTYYKPIRIITIPTLLVILVLDMSVLSRKDTKNLLVNVMKWMKEFDKFYAEDVKHLDQVKQKCKALFF